MVMLKAIIHSVAVTFVHPKTCNLTNQTYAHYCNKKDFIVFQNYVGEKRKHELMNHSLCQCYKIKYI